MSRTLIVSWEGLEEGSFCEGDRISLFVKDKQKGKMVLLDLDVMEVSEEGEARYQEEREGWNPTLFKE